MRVLLTTDTIGGVWTYTRELTNGLLEKDHSVSLVSFGRRPSVDQTRWCTETTTQHSDNFCYLASDVPLEWMANNDEAYSAAEDLLLELARAFRSDILHTNQYCFGRLPFSIPKLVVAHSDVLSWAAACRPEGLPPSSWLERYQSLVQQGLDAADAIVAPTHWMLRALAEHFSLPSLAQVIPNGYSLTPSAADSDPKFQAVTAGRLWDPAKGISRLADVHACLPVLVAGEDRHEDQGVAAPFEHVTMLGRLEQDQLHQLFRSSAIYLALSIYEPFGLSPLEAALCGCAIVARDIPSLREVWGTAALYFEDEQSLTSLLARLASAPELLVEFQRRAIQCASPLSRSRMTNQYLALYQHLIDPTQRLHAAGTCPEVSSDAS